VGKYADTPYHFSKLCIYIHSAEELCYLFKTNPFILDQDIVDRNLAEWLEKECGLTELGRKLHGLFHKASSISLFVSAILEHVNYCTPAEQRQIADILRSNAGLNDYERKKRQADFLVRNGKYLLALQEYERILDRMPEGERVVSGQIYHNRGVALTGLFLFDRAAESFLRAYEISRKEESGVQYLAAVRQQMTDEAYIRFIADHPDFYNLSLKVEYLMEQALGGFEMTEENRMLFTLKVYKEEGNVNSYYEETGRLAEEIKWRYRDSVAE
jgi:tetratricopeptide (TPR) repeat protein